MPRRTAPADPVERAEVAELQADALFEQLLAAAAAPDPAATRVGTVIGKTIDDQTGTLAVPMVASQVETAGYTTIYDRRTGAPSVVNNNMLQQALKKLHPETGEIMYLHRPPANVTPFVGQLKCRLHPDDPDRALWDQMGLPVCPKANLRTENNVLVHMKTRHKQEWAAIKEREDRMEREEAKLERRALLSVVTSGRVAPPETAA
jgi:hypothetical protein